jgi:membrane dipeptidase
MEEALLPGSDQSTREHQPTVPRHPRRDFLAAAVAASGLPLLGGASSARAEEPFVVDRDPLLSSKNPVIVKARDAALDALKPSKAQLERGLELHRRSLVFDAYGFAPRAALDPEALMAAFNAGASDAELNDLQEEQGMLRALVDADERAEFAEAMRCAGVSCIFQNAGEEGQDLGRLIKRLARFTHLSDMLRDTLRRASLPDDIVAARKDGRHCLYLTGNGVPLPQTWNTVEEELGYVRLFYQLGIRMMHLTYNRRNMLGDGCAEPANGGISDFGRAAIAEMNRVGVIVDVAHSGWKTSLEAAQASRRPMVASHTTCADLHRHIRGKPDEVLKAIAGTGGLIGICWIPQFLGGQGDIVALLDHIDHAVKQVGVDHVAIGTDASHTSQHVSKAKGKLPPRRKQHPRFAALWPPDALSGTYPRSITLGWTNWPLVTVGLVQRGYKDEAIGKILGGNMMRVCKEVLPR